jgi:hypothetical protein
VALFERGLMLVTDEATENNCTEADLDPRWRRNEPGSDRDLPMPDHTIYAGRPLRRPQHRERAAADPLAVRWIDRHFATHGGAPTGITAPPRKVATLPGALSLAKSIRSTTCSWTSARSSTVDCRHALYWRWFHPAVASQMQSIG